MPRRATSPEEIAQIARVHALLGDIDVAPPPYLVVSLANGKTHEGQLLDLRAGNTRKKDGSWFSFGAITLATGADKIEIDYLDIVSAQKGGSRFSHPHPDLGTSRMSQASSNAKLRGHAFVR
jgi:hypothetical protein